MNHNRVAELSYITRLDHSYIYLRLEPYSYIKAEGFYLGKQDQLTLSPGNCVDDKSAFTWLKANNHRFNKTKLTFHLALCYDVKDHGFQM